MSIFCINTLHYNIFYEIKRRSYVLYKGESMYIIDETNFSKLLRSTLKFLSKKTPIIQKRPWKTQAFIVSFFFVPNVLLKKVRIYFQERLCSVSFLNYMVCVYCLVSILMCLHFYQVLNLREIDWFHSIQESYEWKKIWEIRNIESLKIEFLPYNNIY